MNINSYLSQSHFVIAFPLKDFRARKGLWHRTDSGDTFPVFFFCLEKVFWISLSGGDILEYFYILCRILTHPEGEVYEKSSKLQKGIYLDFILQRTSQILLVYLVSKRWQINSRSAFWVSRSLSYCFHAYKTGKIKRRKIQLFWNAIWRR